jgi:hypothetical protein
MHYPIARSNGKNSKYTPIELLFQRTFKKEYGQRTFISACIFGASTAGLRRRYWVLV